MIILPDKTIRLEYSVIGIGAIILQCMGTSESVSSLWEKLKLRDEINTYEKFISGLILLFSIGIIMYNNGVLTKNKQ